jgi:hypothetical protein
VLNRQNPHFLARADRAWVVRQELAERQYASEDIQALFRGFVARKKYGFVRRDIFTLQRYIRGWLARRWFRPALGEYRKQIRSVMRVQAMWRGVPARLRVRGAPAWR